MLIATVSLSVVYIGTKLLLDESKIQPYEITYWLGTSVAISMFLILKFIEYREKSIGVKERSYDIFHVPR